MMFVRKKAEIPFINVAPLVDIIFILLIFFMLSSNFIKPMLMMELPKASHVEEKLEKVDIIVTADSAGALYVNRIPVEINNLQNVLTERMAEVGKYDVIFSGDGSIPYEMFVKILDIAKEAGATSFSVEHDKEK